MVNTKEQKPQTRRVWLSNNIVGLFVAALLAAVFGFQAKESSENYQDRVQQTTINTNVIKNLEILNANCKHVERDLEDLDEEIKENHDEIDELDDRVDDIEIKLK